MPRRSLLPAVCCALLGLLAPAVTPAPALAVPGPPAALTNLAHLDSLTTGVTPPAQAGHTTYRISEQPSVGVLWVYANALPGGGYQPTGGGTYDPATNTYGQGAYDADDIARAAVVYLRHWRQDGDAHSRDQALPVAARPDVSTDRDRPRRRRRRAVDAAGRHAPPDPHPGGHPQPLGQRPLVLAGPYRVGARRGLRGLPSTPIRPSQRSCGPGWTWRSPRWTAKS